VSQIATIGHNSCPFDLMAEHLNDLYAEAAQWLDGEPVTTQQQADALNTLETRIREAAKDTEALRKVEAKPFDDGKAEVQARYNPLIQKDKGKADMAINAIKGALRPYLLELDRKNQEIANQARIHAEAAQAIAAKAMAERNGANLAQREEADRLAVLAKEAEQDATRAANAKAHAKGEGRATGLRTVWKATITDERAAAGWLWTDHHDELMDIVQQCADRAVRAGKRTIPGVTITEEKVL